VKEKTLNNAPLVEALFEVKWQLKEIQPGFLGDPHYTLLIGSLYNKLRNRYPYHQALPAAVIPSEMIAGMVQHRFRTGKEKWPLIQLGPGLFTVNHTTDYGWQDFEQRIVEGVNALFEVHPNPQELKIQNLVLRYINAIAYDFVQENVFEFLSQQLKTDVSLHTPLFEGTSVDQKPLGFDLRFTFRCAEPKGIINLRFSRGKKEQKDAVIWETILETHTHDVPELPTELENWLDEAHAVIEDWFFKLIKGDLETKFQ
jgi:uncharacterized protein (TIGR04255 family)